MLVKTYIAMAIIAIIAAAGLGAFSVRRCGCRLYERFCVPEAENNVLWGTACAAMFLGWIFIAQPILNLGWKLAETQGWSMTIGGLIAIVITALVDMVLGLLARLAFSLGKAVSVSILRKQQVKQRETCRQLHQQMAQIDFNRIPCEEAFATYTNCKKQIVAHCSQPEPVKCPIGVKRPLGYIDGAALVQKLNLKGKSSPTTSERDDRKEPELFEIVRGPRKPMNSAIVTVSLHRNGPKAAQKKQLPRQDEPEFFDLRKSAGTSPASVAMMATFVPYYEGEREFCLAAPHAEELESILSNFAQSDGESA